MTKRVFFIEIGLLVGFTSVIVFAQLLAGPIWAQLSGSPAFASPFLGVTGLALWSSLIIISCFQPARVTQFFRNSKGLRCFRMVSTFLGFSILYPFGFQFDAVFPWAPTTSIVISVFVCGLALWFHWAFVLQAFLVTVAIGSYLSAPPYLWCITDLRHTLNIHALTTSFIVLTVAVNLFRRCLHAKQREQGALLAIFIGEERLDAYFLLALVACSMSYFYAGLAKIYVSGDTGLFVDGLSWVWREKIDHLVHYFFLIGSTWIPNFCEITVALEFLRNPYVRITMCAIVLLAELGMITFLMSRRYWLVSIIGCQLLHIGFSIMCGTYFWHWIVINSFLIFCYSRDRFSRYTTTFDFHERALVTVSFFFLSPLVFHTCALGWLTGSEDRVVVLSWQVVEEFTQEKSVRAEHHLAVIDPVSGSMTMPINPNHFFPYEKSFQMSWKLGHVFDDPEYAKSISKNMTGITTTSPDAIDENVQASVIAHESSVTRKITTAKLKKKVPVSFLGKVKDVFACCKNFYKFRLYGQWHEQLICRSSVVRNLVSDLHQVLNDAHLRRRKKAIWPPYYSHMTFNSKLFQVDEGNQEVNEYLLVKHVYDNDFQLINHNILFRCSVSPTGNQGEPSDASNH
jgi:hypothetical protein